MQVIEPFSDAIKWYEEEEGAADADKTMVHNCTLLRAAGAVLATNKYGDPCPFDGYSGIEPDDRAAPEHRYTWMPWDIRSTHNHGTDWH